MLDLVNKLQNFDLDSVRYFQSVIVLCAGGTINMSGLTERKPANGVQNAIEAIRKKFESLNITIIVLDIFDRPPDSSNIGESEWTQIYNSIAAVINKKKEIAEKLIALGIALEQGGIVVAHGTDTLHITSLVISLELLRHNLAFPIVFTASHSTFEMPNSDARKNLEKSIFVAKECFGLSTVSRTDFIRYGIS